MRDAVALLDVPGIGRLQLDRDARLPQGVLVPLEHPFGAGVVAVTVGRDALPDLREREWPPGVEEKGDQVQEAFQRVHPGDDNAVVIRVREGVVVRVVTERAGALELSVEVEGEPADAVAYPALVGPVAAGDPVLVNTTAVALGLGSGGAHFVVAVL